MIKMLRWLSYGLVVFSFNISAATINDGLVLFNQKEFKEAKAIFGPLAEQGDARAMFWLGVTQFRTGEQFKASSSLHEAAEAGDPWAMHLMVPSYNGNCAYLGWPCDEAWMDKAISGWKKLADKGNGNAMYALLRWGEKPWWAYVPILKQKKYGELVEDAVKAGGYDAVSFNTGIPLNIRKRVEILQYAINKNHAPSMIDLYSASENHISMDIDKVVLLKRALFLGFGGQVLIFELKKMIPDIESSYDLEHLSIKEKKMLSDLYYYSLINQKVTGKLDFKPYKRVYGEQRERIRLELFSPEKKKEIEEKARKFLVDFKVNLFIDEASSVHALLR